MLYPQNYHPDIIYIITGPSNSGKTFLTQAILNGLLDSAQPDQHYINHAYLEDNQNTAHITINDDPANPYLIIDKLHAHQISFGHNRDDLAELIMQHRPKILIFNGQDPDGNLVEQLLNNLALKDFRPRIITITH